MSKRSVTLAVVAALALAGQPALAQRSRGGGHPGGGGGYSHAAPRGGGSGYVPGGGHPGGGHPGYGRAVPRGGGSGYVPGGVAQARHPRAGSGYSYGYSGRGHYPGYGYGHYPSYGHGHYPGYGYGYYPRYGYGYYSPYYGGYYGGYYGSSFGLYLGFGSPYAYGYYGWPYGYGGAPYPYPPTADVYLSSPDTASGAQEGSADRRPDETPGVRDSYVPNTGRVRLEVRPGDATVYVDDEFWGSASESRLMTLRAGRHAIEIVRPGFGVVHREVDVVAGETSDVLVELPRPS